MQHGSLRAPVRVFMAAVLLVPELSGRAKGCRGTIAGCERHHAAVLRQPADRLHRQPDLGPCSWYALRYARTILDGRPCSGSGMWSNGAVWSAAGYYAYSGSLSDCLSRLHEELQAGRPVIVHLKNTAVSGVSKHTNRVTSYEYHLSGSGWKEVNYPTSPPAAPTDTGCAWWASPPRQTLKTCGRAISMRWTRAGQRERHTGRNKALDGTIWTDNSPLKVAA